MSREKYVEKLRARARSLADRASEAEQTFKNASRSLVQQFLLDTAGQPWDKHDTRENISIDCDLLIEERWCKAKIVCVDQPGDFEGNATVYAHVPRPDGSWISEPLEMTQGIAGLMRHIKVGREEVCR